MPTAARIARRQAQCSIIPHRQIGRARAVGQPVHRGLKRSNPACTVQSVVVQILGPSWLLVANAISEGVLG